MLFLHASISCVNGRNRVVVGMWPGPHISGNLYGNIVNFSIIIFQTFFKKHLLRCQMSMLSVFSLVMDSIAPTMW